MVVLVVSAPAQADICLSWAMGNVSCRGGRIKFDNFVPVSWGRVGRRLGLRVGVRAIGADEIAWLPLAFRPVAASGLVASGEVPIRIGRGLVAGDDVNGSRGAGSLVLVVDV